LAITVSQPRLDESASDIGVLCTEGLSTSRRSNQGDIEFKELFEWISHHVFIRGGYSKGKGVGFDLLKLHQTNLVEFLNKAAQINHKNAFGPKPQSYLFPQMEIWDYNLRLQTLRERCIEKNNMPEAVWTDIFIQLYGTEFSWCGVRNFDDGGSGWMHALNLPENKCKDIDEISPVLSERDTQDVEELMKIIHYGERFFDVYVKTLTGKNDTTTSFIRIDDLRIKIVD